MVTLQSSVTHLCYQFESSACENNIPIIMVFMYHCYNSNSPLTTIFVEGCNKAHPRVEGASRHLLNLTSTPGTFY